MYIHIYIYISLLVWIADSQEPSQRHSVVLIRNVFPRNEGITYQKLEAHRVGTQKKWTRLV